jgi:general secretion pathway protein A
MSDAPRLAPASRATPASAPLASSAPRVAAAPASAVLPPAPAASAVSLALRNERDAWRELARAWGAELPESEGEDPCPALKEAAVSASASAALRCFRSEEGLALLRQLGRPAILTLDDGSGRPAYVLLTGLAEQEATVRAGGAEQRVGLLALGRQWRGKFATLWRTPPGYGERLEPGVAQDWVAARLEQLFGDAADTGRGSALRERIAAFQRAQGLKSDGRAGPITLMQLNRAAGVDEPRLQH